MLKSSQYLFMKVLIFLSLGIFLTVLLPKVAYARVTPGDIYQAQRVQFLQQLETIEDPVKREKVKKADLLLSEINQQITHRFEGDILRLAAILQELKARLNMEGQETVVAFGQGKTPLENADYWVNYAQEAVAYQKIQDYTPQIRNEAGLIKTITPSKERLRQDLMVLRSKVLRAKGEAGKALKYAK